MCSFTFAAYFRRRASMWRVIASKGWDIKVAKPSGTTLIQTKTISYYSKTCKLSPIHQGWDELHVVYLDAQFQPSGFYVITDTSIVAEGSLRECYGPRPGTDRRGTATVPFGPNRIAAFLRGISRALAA